MKILFVVSFLIVCFIASCKQPPAKENKINYKDSIIKKYFALVDRLPFYDTNNVDHKILKAYVRNDVDKLEELYQRAMPFKFMQWVIDLDSCVTQKEINNINAVEAYRFIYSAAFCPYTTKLTIIKYKNSTVLETVVYQHAYYVPCKVIENYSMKIDSKGWENFEASMKYADFWGLKEDNDVHGVDGSTLEVYGYKKGGNWDWDPSKTSFVSRWSPYQLPIMESFSLLLEYSGATAGCITRKRIK